MYTIKSFLVSMAVVWGVGITIAQQDSQLFGALKDQEREALEALMLYPQETRDDILEATLHPELLIRIKAMQQETQGKFDAEMKKYEQETQQFLWDLTRYPDLIQRMAALDLTADRALDRLLKEYPDVIHKQAKEAFTHYYDDLKAMDAIQQASNAAFERLLTPYSAKTRAAYRALLQVPEVLSILSENIDLVVLTGDLYQKDPARVRAKADSLNEVAARQQAKDLEDWKEYLEKNAGLEADLKATAQEFADEYGYDDAYYNYDTDDLYYEADAADKMVMHDYYYYNYPYWFGYPSWYVYPRWRPYPYWWEWGFYMQANRTIIVVQMPSLYFVNWYFYYPHHHYYYPHITDHFIRYYENHPRSMNSITMGVNRWEYNNRDVITNSWLKNEQNRVERIQEFGRFEFERRKYNSAHPNENLTPYEYQQRNSTRYPDIQATPEVNAPRTRTTPQPKERIKIQEPRQPEAIPKRQPAKQSEQPHSRNDNYEDLNKAKELHRQTWERDKQTPPPATREPQKLKKAPEPKVAPRKQESSRTPVKTNERTRKQNN